MRRALLLVLVMVASLLGSGPPALASYTSGLLSPTPPDASDTFVWVVDGVKAGLGREVGTVRVSGCWTAEQVEDATATDASGETLTADVHAGGPHADTIEVEGLSDRRLPVTIAVTFREVSGSDPSGTSVFVKTGGGRDAGETFDVAGPTCRPPAAAVVTSLVAACEPGGGQVCATLELADHESQHGRTIVLRLVDVDGDPMGVPDQTITVDRGTAAYRICFELPDGYDGRDVRVVVVEEAGSAELDDTSVTASDPVACEAAEPPPPPPAPDLEPSAIDPTVATSLFRATEFLYTGDDPVQTGVAAGAIDPVRAAVVRGVVRERGGNPLPGVAVSIKDHPEYGQTVTRADGAYDLAVNGGGPLTLDYRRDGRLPAQRTIDVPWRDYRVVDDVVLVPLDPLVTTVDLSGGAADWQVAQGSQVTDADGTRRATLLFPPGVAATMILPGGSTQPVTSGDVRLTEYTVGEDGQAAMPGELPAASAYTYAVELSLDEAIAADAVEVRFDEPVVAYVDDFLGFDAGAAVPLGHYDRQRAVWVAAANGVVVTVVSVTGGLADLDLDGDGEAEDAAGYAAAGITDGERAALAQQQAPGGSLWRVTVDHFTPWDMNWPFVPVFDPAPDERPPTQPPPRPPRRRTLDKDCEQSGSVLACESQVLGESLPVTGTPFGLHYRTDRVPGQRASVWLDIPVTGPVLPPQLRRVILEIEVAGRREVVEFAPEPDLVHPFEWDRRDAYGRLLQGAQTVEVTITYEYEPVVAFARVSGAGALAQGFGRFFEEGGTAALAWAARGGRVTGPPTRSQQRHRIEVAAWSVPVAQAIGGWTLDPHHTYDPDGRTVYLGDGGRYSADPFGAGELKARTILYRNDTLLGAEGNPVEGEIGIAGEVAAGPDGALYVVDPIWHRLVRVDPAGEVTTVAGTGQAGFSGDGGPATAAQLNNPQDVALTADGAILVADTFNHRIRRIDQDGTITTFAGTGTFADTGDGGPATAAAFASPTRLAVAPDGDVLVVGANPVVRRIAPDGLVTTAVGSGATQPFAAGRAVTANLWPTDVAVASDGSLLITDAANRDLYRVTGEGDIVSLRDAAGGAFPEFTPNAVSLFEDGSLLLRAGAELYRTDLDGTRKLVADSVAIPECRADDTQLTQLCSLRGAVPTPDGNVVLTDFVPGGRARVVRLGPVLPGFTADQQVVASRDAGEVFVFDADGRHLRTVDALTGATRFAFGYDAGGRLTAVTDVYGRTTTIERDGDGQPLRIVAPAGEATVLQTNADGYLTRLENPAGEAHVLAYTPLGLLTEHRMPSGATSTYGYTNLGLLESATGPDGATLTLARKELPGDGHRVTYTDQTGRETRYTVEVADDGTVTRATVEPGGATTVVENRPDGTATITDPDGTVVETAAAPHPRFGLQAPYPGALTVTRPDGTVSRRTEQRAFEVAADGTVERRQTTVTTDGRTWTAVYVADPSGGGMITTTSPAGRTEEVTLDALGRAAAIRTAGGLAPLQLVYDDLGRLVERRQGPWSETYGYDDDSYRVTARTDSTGRTVGYRYDAADRIVAVELPGGGEVAIRYDADGNRTGVTMPSGATHELEADARGRLAGYLPPDQAEGYASAYDSAGNRTAATLPSGRTQDFTHDPAGRLAAIDYDEAAVAIGYVGATRRIDTVARTGGGTTETLDRAWAGDRLVRETASGASSGVFAYAYNPDGQLVRSTLDGAALTLSYDADGALTRQGPFTYTADGPGGDPTLIAAPGQEIALAYDELGRMTERVHTHAGAEVYAQELAYDAAGRVVGQVERVRGVASTLGYDYDADGRLVRVTRDGAVVETYAYDANGNRTARTLAGGATQTAGYDSQDRLVDLGGVAVTHDADGFRTASGDERYAYSARGELLSATLADGRQVTYTHDGLGRRTSRTLDGRTTTYLYGNPDNPYEVTASRDADGVLSRYLYDAGRRLLAVERAGQRYAVATDHLGTPRVVADPTGAVVATFDHNAWGLPGASTGTFDLAIGFAGGLADPDTGLVRFGARDYDPESGRWMSRDPALYGGRQANLYVYAASSPVSLVDPTGAFSFGASAYAGIGGGIKLSITREGFSVCGELGLGGGAGLSVDPFGDLDPNGSSLNLELSTRFGPVEASLTASKHGDCPNPVPEVKAEACLAGAVCTDGSNLTIKEGLGEDPPIPKPRAGAEAKLTFQQCGGLLF